MIHDRNDSKQLALAAVMFFSIMVKNLLKQNSQTFSPEEKAFVTSYIYWGYWSMLSGAISVLSTIGYYLYSSTILYWIHTTSIVATIGIILVGCIGALSGSTISTQQGRHTPSIQEDRATIILAFVPIYNMYVWYSLHTFIKPNKRIKESLVWRTLRCSVGLLQPSHTILMFVSIFLVIRVATIAYGIDIIQDKIKDAVADLFTVNPEELFGYVLGFIDAIRQYLNSSTNKPSIGELAQNHKKTYSQLHTWNSTLGLQYAIGAMFIIRYVVAHYDNAIDSRFVYAPVIVIVARYALMYRKWKHLPSLPIAKELLGIIQRLWAHIRNKHFTQ